VTLVKVLLTPALIAVATLLARRWGPGVGGIIVGLPLTSTPVSIFLALEQGPAFAATAAAGTLLGLLSQAALCLVYSWTARRAAWWTSAVTGVATFLGVTLLLERTALSLPVAFTLVCVLLLIAAAAVPAPAGAIAPARPPSWDLPVRMFVATTIVLGLTTAAAVLGPRWTGLLSPFPVFALVLGAFTHRAQGAGAAAHLLRGVVLGSLAHATVFALVASLLISHGLVWTYSWASLAGIAVNGLAVVVVRQRGRALDARRSAGTLSAGSR
jgi:hypothetical protein